MEKSSSNKRKFFLRRLNLLFLLVPAIYSCNPTKYVPQGESLLNSNHIQIDREGINKSDLVPYIKQKPNKQIFGARFHLGLYNFSNLEKKKWPHAWLRNIGEEPVIFDQYATEKSREQLENLIRSKGFFDSRVTDSVRTVKRKSDVYYNVNLKTPYTIRNLYYEIADTTIKKLFDFDSTNCLIQRGKPYDATILQAERTRFERYVKNHGFYSFSTDHIAFRVDSTIGNRQVNLFYEIHNFQKTDIYNRITNVPHPVYQIKNVYIYTDYVQKDVLEGGESYINSLDTVNYNGYYFISQQKKSPIKYDLILRSLYLKPGSGYSISNTEQTQSHLMSLKTYRLVNIFFNETGVPDGSQESQSFLNCHIQLTLLSNQSFNVELEGTNTAGNLGGALNLIYQHKNLFHGAEQFNMKLKGAFEAMTQQNTKLRSTREYGIETTLRLPRFIVPFFRKEGFIKTFNPTTTILAAYNYQDLTFFTRTMANATFGYNWAARNYKTHIVNPVQLNLVNMIKIDTGYQKLIDASSYLANSFKDVLILGGNYSYIYNNQKIQNSRDYLFLRVNAEAAGNMLALASNLAGAGKKEGYLNFFGQPFAQYIRTDIDIRYNIILNDASSIVYRGFAGIGIPYGNSKVIPFEKQYFGGGANGIRAWQVRSLGPGSFDVPKETVFINQTADIKLEANAEYRFKLFWILEGALFLDAGNIWTFNEDSSRPGAMFRFNKFLNDIAVGTGTGFRFDFSFVTARLDMGLKLRDPSIANGSRWILMSRRYDFRNDLTFVLGIGYPF
ncbi:MAG TPA: outer membrane protein assembly factor [Bacteroidales bacterium]|nr:outer membrane protein assembly factor [Bacteroidales bacterium]HBZ19594.1 outer membrane protein assembly factor [Bacteroidales bacterium]